MAAKPGEKALLAEPVALARALVREGKRSGLDALRLVAPAVQVLWEARGGPAALSGDPTALPADRAVLAALGYDVSPDTGELTLARVLRGEAASDG